MLICSAGLSSITISRLRRGCANSLIRRQRIGDAFPRRRLGDEGERAARQAVLTVLVERDDLNRDMPRQRVLLELAEHGPAEHVGQEHIERHGGRLILLGEIDRVVAAHRHQRLECLCHARDRSGCGRNADRPRRSAGWCRPAGYRRDRPESARRRALPAMCSPASCVTGAAVAPAAADRRARADIFDAADKA